MGAAGADVAGPFRQPIGPHREPILRPDWFADVGLSAVDQLHLASIALARRQPAGLTEHGLPVPDRELQRAVWWVGERKGPPVHTETLLGLCPVEQLPRSRQWLPSPGGPPWIIQPVTASGEPGDLRVVDLLAWRPADPDFVLRLTGAATWLGSPDPPPLAEPSWSPVLVWSPREWLRRPHAAVCILDWRPAVVVRLAAALSGRVVFQDLDLMELYRSTLLAGVMPAQPEILDEPPTAEGGS